MYEPRRATFVHEDLPSCVILSASCGILSGNSMYSAYWMVVPKPKPIP